MLAQRQEEGSKGWFPQMLGCVSDGRFRPESQEGRGGSEGLCLKWTKAQLSDIWRPLPQEWANIQWLAIFGAVSEPQTLMGSHTLGSQLSSGSHIHSQPKAKLGCPVINCFCFLTKGVDALKIRAVGGGEYVLKNTKKVVDSVFSGQDLDLLNFMECWVIWNVTKIGFLLSCSFLIHSSQKIPFLN